MREFEFIHSDDDVSRTLAIAADLGLTIRLDIPTSEPKVNVLNTSEITNARSGPFILFRPEWVFSSLTFERIKSGYNEGKYFQNPTTNYAGILLYFSGERTDGSLQRLGSGLLSRDMKWMKSVDGTLHDAPSQVKSDFDSIRLAIDTRRRLRGGVHNYAVLDGAWKKLNDGLAVPPFDFIEWHALK